MQHNDLVKLSDSPIPVYYIHSFEQPFCDNPLCFCQLQRQETVKLFVQVIEGKLLLEHAQSLLAERMV